MARPFDGPGAQGETALATPNQLPAKSPILPKYRSRLQITYRTNISGTPVPVKLPFRVLVMGDFLGKAQRVAEGQEIRDRKIRSIQMGAIDTSVPALMKEMTPWMQVPKKLPAAPVSGYVVLKNLSFPVPDDVPSGDASVTVSGTATFSSALSDNHVGVIAAKDLPVTGTLKVVQGTPMTLKAGETMTMTLSGAVQGDITDSGTGKVSGVLTAFFDKVQIPIAADDLQVDGDGNVTFKDSTKNKNLVTAARTIPFQSLSSFSPDQVAASIPELHRLMVIRGLVLELQSNLQNNRAFAKAVRDLLGDTGAGPPVPDSVKPQYKALKISEDSQ